MKRNKYTYLYVIQQDWGYGHGWEDVDAYDKADPFAYTNARKSIATYRQEQPVRTRMIERRELNGEKQ